MGIFTDTCIVPDTGHRNQDTYIRVLDKPRKDGGRLVMLHRLEWEKINGQIPAGYEVNHKCGNRECSNVNHMELLTRKEHATKDNAFRYSNKSAEVLVYCLANPHLTQREVAEIFGICQTSVWGILNKKRVWKFR
jgi:hypothetical protein